VKALVTAEFPAAGLAALRELGYETRHLGWGVTRQALSEAELAAALHGTELLVCEVERVGEHVFAAAPALCLVAACRGEPTNIDLSAATSHGVAVLHTPGRNAASVGDCVIGAILAEARSIARGERHLRESGWEVEGDLPYFHFRGPELSRCVLGLIGFGAVGREVARRASQGFGMHVLIHDPYVEVLEPYEPVELDELLKRSDIVSIHCPPTTETIGMIGKREFALMRSHAYVVNSTRAAVVDEEALVAALRERTIAGAALDVFWQEPLPREHPLLALSNVTITPHLAGAADDVKEHHAAMVLADLARWRAGERPLHLANPEVWPEEAAVPG
jgi:D-3-phosphoglycerate dehydrogenase / 2-oxoglutarate reductase